MTEHRFAEVVVTDKAVIFDGKELPWHIAQDGIRYDRSYYDDIGRLSIDFLVEDVHFTLREPRGFIDLYRERFVRWEDEHNDRWDRLTAETWLNHWLQLGAFIALEEEYA
ncbi:hypothetical protein KIY87_gp60 [Mycobacterium phage Malec]|uniref:Uncharacterized protein n=2 Tax=Turbidovirus TaxID=2948936 RepID=A0A0A0RN37_9CAUD|nr:hypothetical protein PBI_LARENN_40 [Mycobacterium phage Larenn]YP_010064132.1 hypothetical protein KIY87_gp60 [Mycobacterium phage Malec]AIW02935.1 hypothetical protein PBI_LARENN_40 [Mycobacterium phage Larenn]AZV00835.1 hypothetical protein SEA_MALEC_41 [Mycobacterium phage Malec]